MTPAGEQVRPRWFANVSTLLVLFALLQMTIANGTQDSADRQAGVITNRLDTLNGFGWGLVNVNQDVINTFYDVTVNGCMLECSARPLCKGFEYQTVGKFCKLVSNDAQRVRRPGYFSLTGFETLSERPYSSCNGSTCVGNKSCAMSTTTGQMECQIQECGHPSIGEPLFGNRYQRNSRLLIQRTSTHDLQPATCKEDGTWEYEDAHPYPGLTCGDILRYRRDATSGVYLNNLNISVYCEFENEKGWLVFQRRKDGSGNFSRNWEDYKNGFGNLSGEFWLGLEPLYRILSSNSGVSFMLQIDLKDWKNVSKTATYDFFSISDASTNYALNISGFNGRGGLNDTFNISNGLPFSTLDADNDIADGVNCAEIYKGGWWYTACVDASLNGQFFGIAPQTHGEGIIWKGWTADNETLQATKMKIRRNGD